MRNLKKLLAVITVVAIMATLFVIPASAASLSDVAGTAYESAVTRLNALGIITGRTDGKFYPNDTITRAEFAAVVIRGLGYNTAADSAKGQTKFSDVNADFWASGYINLASSLGIIKGRPDGTFGANDKVLYEEAVTMVVRALGYEPAAAANGGYPTGYLTIASQEDIDDDAVAAVGSPASRGLVAQLVDNSLEVAMMIQVGYGTEQKFVKSGTEGTAKQTLLDSKLKLDVYKARVLSTGDKLEVRYTDATSNPADMRNTKESLSVIDGLSQAGLKDALVTLWVKDDKVYSIKVESTVLYDVISKINDKDDVADLSQVKDINDIKLKIADTTYDLATNNSDDVTSSTVEVKVDNVAVADYTAANSADALLNKWAKVIVDDGKVTKIYAYTMTEGGLVTGTAADYVTYTKGETEDKKLRGLEDADSLLVVIDNKAADYSALKADMYFEYSKVDDDYVIAASSAKAEGKLDKAKSNKISIGGTFIDLAGGAGKYYFSKDNGGEYDNGTASANDFSDFLGANVVAYKNLSGKIVYVKGNVEETTETFYGFVKGVNSFNDQLKIVKNVDGEAKTVTYDTDLEDASPITLATANVTDENGNGIETETERKNAFYKFTFNSDNVITKIEDAGFIASNIGTTANNDNGATFNKDSDFILGTDGTRVYVTADTLMFNLTGTDIKLLKWTDIENADVAATAELVAYYKQNDTTAPAFVLFDNSVANVAFSSKDGYLAFVNDMYRQDKDNYAIEATIPGNSKTFVVDDGKIGAAAKNSIIAYKLTSTTDKIEVVAAGTYDNFGQIGNANIANITSDSDWANVSGEVAVDGVDGSYIKIGATNYRVASDAVIYKVSGDDMDKYTVSDLSDVTDDQAAGSNDMINAVTVKGQIKIMFFWEQ